MQEQELVQRVRAFNRFYMPSMRLLGNRYLGSEYSAAEARVFFELYEHEGCNAAFIAQAMQIDKSYLSRILKGYERDGYIRRTPSQEDGRSCVLFLTNRGRDKAEELFRKSDAEIHSILGKLTGDERRRLAQALDTITEILGKDGEP